MENRRHDNIKSARSWRREEGGVGACAREK
jgi:hypothetical protein